MSESTAVTGGVEQDLDALDGLIDRLFSADLTSLDPAALTTVLSRVETASIRLGGCSRRTVAEADRRGLAGEFGATSTGGLLQDVLRVSRSEAGSRVRQAQEFAPRVALTGEILPPLFAHVAEALDAGEISVAHARIIAKTRSDLPAEIDAICGDDAEAVLVAQAKKLNPTQLGHVAIRLRDTLNPDGKFSDHADQQRRRYFVLKDNADGTSTPSGHFTPELTALLRPILDSLTAPQPAGDLPDTRTPGQRAHDAIADAASRLIRSGTLPDSGGVPVSIVVTVSEADLRRAEAGESVLVEDAYGTPISLDAVASISAELEIGTVVLSTSGGILSYGRARRLASCAQRRALAVRDKGCSFPGCLRPPAWCEAHHIDEWLIGGDTSLGNLTLLCRYHHRNFQAAGWAVFMGAEGVPQWIPPEWLDPERHPRRNTAHDSPPLPSFL